MPSPDNPTYREQSPSPDNRESHNADKGRVIRKTRTPGVRTRQPGEDLVLVPTMKIPKALLKRIEYETDRRMLSRALLVTYVLQVGLDHLPPLPGDPSPNDRLGSR